MSETETSLPVRQRLKLKILLPLSIGLLIFLGFYILSTSWYLEQEIERDLQSRISDIETSFQNLLDQRARIMATQLGQLEHSEELQSLMRQRDRAGLLATARPDFHLFREHLGITHYYFHTPEQEVFLRVHNPNRHSDRIDRHTLERAVATQQLTYGIELGVLGTFTLRTVLPWYAGGELLGYLELGEEIELLINNFFQLKNMVLTLAIDKQHLDRESWEAGNKMLGKDARNWDLLPKKIIIQTSDQEMLPELTRLLQQPLHPRDDITLNFRDRHYQGAVKPVQEASGRYVGSFLMLRDITASLDNYWNTVTTFTLLCLFAASVFLLAAGTILGKTEAQQQQTDLLLLDEMLKVHNSNQQLGREIDERKAAEEELSQIQGELEKRVNERTEQLWLSLEQTQQVRKQLADIVTSVPDGLIVTDLENRILLLNLQAEELFQCSSEESIGKPLREIVNEPQMAEKMEEVTHQQLNDFRFETDKITADLQKSISLQIRASVLTDKQEKSIGMIFLIHDISQEREIERMKSEFISTAVHELSTPLTAILGFSELLLENKQISAEEHVEFLGIINEKADFLSSLVGELLDISRIESGKPLPLQAIPVSVKELFERPIQHLRLLSEEHQFTINLEQPEIQLLVDKEKIWQVMENLCSNAVKYSPTGGEVSISGKSVAAGYQVTISDQGIGLTDEQKSKVFEKFYRGNQSDTSIGGTGLGLTIVKYIIENHNGEIWIESDLGSGTKVHFILPVQA